MIILPSSVGPVMVMSTCDDETKLSHIFMLICIACILPVTGLVQVVQVFISHSTVYSMRSFFFLRCCPWSLISNRLLLSA